MRLTEQQYSALTSRGVLKAQPKARGMNKLEAAYAEVLERQKRAGMIHWYKFEAIKLRLGEGTFFKPDFAVVSHAGLEFREVKGFMREAARVRLKVAAEMYPFKFYLVKYDRGAFVVREV